MASAGTTYPKLGRDPYARLRARAATAPSTKFTAAAVAVMLGFESPNSASQNVVGPMRRLGLIDENGMLTSRGNMWRNDDTYADACREILEEIYPDELTAFTDAAGTPSKSLVTKWFQQQKFGDSNARQMAATYVMIAEQKVPEVGDKETGPKGKKSQPAAGANPKTSTPATSAALGSEVAAAPLPAQPRTRPDIHLDIQIHIAADAQADQIETIFASMAKYLYAQQ